MREEQGENTRTGRFVVTAVVVVLGLAGCRQGYPNKVARSPQRLPMSIGPPQNFMMGDANGGGNCRKACGKCRVCSESDVACINENREKAGYLPLDRSEMEWLGVPW